MRPFSREWMAAAKVEQVGTANDGEITVNAYHFDTDPDTGVPFATTVVSASFAAGVYAEHAEYSISTRLWNWRWTRASAVTQAVKRLRAKLDNPDSSR
ncbi:hypothetical protein SEA_MARIOKART_54 [Gordonia phage Mariokart]|nr:hypothetical protein SEA_MARIOKART_54 [Gordonia phage Mariokart]